MEVLGEKFTGGISAGFNSFAEKLKEFFIPTFNPLTEFIDVISSRFGFLPQIVTILKGFFVDISDEAPIFAINFKGKLINIIDFSVFEPYRPLLFTIQYSIYTYYFLNWLIKFIPRLLGGIGE